MAQNKVKAVTRTSLAGMSLSGTYQAINTSGLGEACFMIRLVNTTNGAVDVSYDGTNDHDVIPLTSYIEVSGQTNAQPQGWTAVFAKGQKIYVKGSAAAGSVYLSAYYVTP